MDEGREISLSEILCNIKKNLKLLFTVTAVVMALTLSALITIHFTKPIRVTQQLRIGSYLSANNRQTINTSDYVLNTILTPLLDQSNLAPSTFNVTASKNLIRNPKGELDSKGQPLKFTNPDDTILLLQAAVPQKQFKAALNEFKDRCDDIAKSVKLSEDKMLENTQKIWKQQQTLNKLKLTLLKDTQHKLAPLSSDNILKKTFQGQSTSMTSPQSDKTSNLFTALMTNERITQFGLQANKELVQTTAKIDSVNDELASLTPAHLVGKPFIQQTTSHSVRYLLMAFILSIIIGLLIIAVKEAVPEKR